MRRLAVQGIVSLVFLAGCGSSTPTITNPTIATTSPTFAAAGGAGFTLTVRGTNFVPGSVVNFGGTTPATTVVSSSQLTATIPAAAIATAGNASVTVTNPAPGGTSNAVNFTITSGTNPVPTITTISPTSAAAGGAGFTLTVNGTNFVAASVVNFGGTTPATTVLSSSQLTAAIPAAAIASPGTVPVTVTNPAPAGGTSNAVNFTINSRPSGTFTPTGNMTTPRAGHTATLLPTGKVLIAGGAGPSAELYDPSTGTFTTTGSMISSGGGPSTLLQDGRVLITASDNAEIYDPASGTFALTGPYAAPKVFVATATLLQDGRVLVTGCNAPQCIVGEDLYDSVGEVYDPTTGTFTATGALVESIGDTPSASLLPDGRVLIAAEPTAEIYDPGSGTFSLTGAMTTRCWLGVPSYLAYRTATVLMNGTVLVAGGEQEDCGRFADAELYYPATGTFTATGSMTRARDNHTATLLADGTVLIAGGETEDCDRGGCFFSGTTASAESYVPTTGTFVTVSEMTARRAGHSATLLNDGTVLIAGGYCYGCGVFVFATAEIYKPTAP